jgi:hypothetical protein
MPTGDDLKAKKSELLHVVGNMEYHEKSIEIITVLWEQWYNLWKLRNDDVHGKDAAARAIADKREVAQSLAMIYDQRNHMEPSMQALLQANIKTHLEQSTWAIQNWINIQGPGFAESVKRVKKNAIQNMRSI